MKDCKLDVLKTTSKTSLLNQMVLRAWRERWSVIVWGISIKKVLPRGVSGDAYNLADCILQQALVGSTANPLVLNYLKHSLCAHLVSHAAVLRRIARYDHIERTYCITTLLEFLESIIEGATCRNKSEECLMPAAALSLVHWLLHIIASVLQRYELEGQMGAEQSYMLERACSVAKRFYANKFLMGVLCVGRHEDAEAHANVREQYASIKTSLTNSNFSLPQGSVTEKCLLHLSFIDVGYLEMPLLDLQPVDAITYCVQPLLAVEVLLNPCKDTPYYVAEMQMIQRLKNFSNTRLFYEIIRAGFISLSNVVETSHDTMWGAFTFFKVPQIIKQLHGLSRTPGDQTPPSDYIPEVVDAIEMLLEDNLLLDFMDTKCSCNIIEYLLNDWTKQHLVNEMHVKHFAAQRENNLLLLQKRETGNQAPSIINFIIRAEGPLSGILKTLSTDYNKVQEALLGVLCQVLVGNSFDLILSVATVEGRLRTFVARLIQCNENSKQVPGEVGKASVIRSTLFDVSFLMLTFIVQTYGSEIVLPANGDSFFEKWVRQCLVERNKPKNPNQMIALCDEVVVDELLHSLSKPDGQLKSTSLTWQDICMNLPGVLHHVLIAWEKETLSSADVKSILDNIKRRLFSFSVCATSFLCAYMYSVCENEFLKPLNMIQQFLAPPIGEEMSTQENVKERLGLSFQIIRKMQQDMHPSGHPKARSSLTHAQSLVSQTPLIEQYREVWRTVAEHGWLPVRAAQVFETLLHAGGAAWLVTQLVEQILKCKYTRDMMKTMDIVFAVLHLDIEQATEALLTQVIPTLVQNRQGDDLNEPQFFVLARLAVYCIISCLETRQPSSTATSTSAAGCTPPKKRSRSTDGDDLELAVNSAKMRKLADGSDNSCSNDYNSDQQHLLLNAAVAVGGSSTPPHDSATPSAGSGGGSPLVLSEPLQAAVQHIFRIFQQFVATEELSPKIMFMYQFISLLVECGQQRVGAVLALLPANLIQNLLKVLTTDDVSVGLLCRLYDLRASGGRQAAVADLSLWRNLNLKRESIQL